MTMLNAKISTLDVRELTFDVADGYIRMTIANDRCFGHVRFRRLFPLSRPREFIAVQDDHGNEIGILRKLSELSPDWHQRINDDLENHYVMPVLTTIHAIRSENGLYRWQVTTDRGPREFFVQGRTENITLTDDNRVLIVDTSGGRYDIPDLRRMPRRSQTIIAKVL